MKKCRKCSQEKELEKFPKWKDGKDGLGHYCKDCISKDGIEYRKRNKEKISLRRKKQYKDDPERFRAYNKNSYAKHSRKYKAKQRVYNEINRLDINERHRLYNKKNRELINLKSRKLCATQEGKKKAREYYHTTKEKFDKKIKARNKLRYEVRRGRIMKPDFCEKCFEKKKLHGHHEDYNLPLDVLWVCNKCHKGIHFKIGN